MFSWMPLQKLKYCRCFYKSYESKRYSKHCDFGSFASASVIGDKLSQEGASLAIRLAGAFLLNNKGENHGQ
jgi:hypothetical protein